jgi:exonuclease SbcD
MSDWHLGVSLGRLSREPDLEKVIDEMVDIAEGYRPHLIVHTGDFFDGFRPPVEAMRLGFESLRRLSAFAPVVVIAGNHDSRPLFRLFAQILKLTGAGESDEVIRLACMPFLHPNMLVDVLDTRPEEWTGKYADGVRLLQDMQRRGLEKDYDPKKHINLYAAHLHVGGATLARSERTVAAFGHIHKPQNLPGLVPGRYAGSPIQIDYGELDEQKSVVTVEARPGKAAQINRVDLSGGRNLVRLEGTLEELAAAAAARQEPCILTATVVTEEPTLGLVEEVAQLFPEADLHLVHNRVLTQEAAAVRPDGSAVEETDFRDQFREYLAGREGLGTMADRLASHFDRLLDAVEAETEPILKEESLIGDKEG